MTARFTGGTNYPNVLEEAGADPMATTIVRSLAKDVTFSREDGKATLKLVLKTG